MLFTSNDQYTLFPWAVSEKMEKQYLTTYHMQNHILPISSIIAHTPIETLYVANSSIRIRLLYIFWYWPFLLLEVAWSCALQIHIIYTFIIFISSVFMQVNIWNNSLASIRGMYIFEKILLQINFVLYS